MSSTVGSTADYPNRGSKDNCCRQWGRRGDWSLFNIAAMVIGFALFWPIGLLILYWILKGRSVKELPQMIREKWSAATGKEHRNGGYAASSDNVVFDEFQQTQYDRIREIKDEIKERSRRFAEFRSRARRRADEAEFNEFMSEAPPRDAG
jgi:hypothetical protein